MRLLPCPGAKACGGPEHERGGDGEREETAR
jgi:hypothetical protein